MYCLHPSEHDSNKCIVASKEIRQGKACNPLTLGQHFSSMLESVPEHQNNENIFLSPLVSTVMQTAQGIH